MCAHLEYNQTRQVNTSKLSSPHSHPPPSRDVLRTHLTRGQCKYLLLFNLFRPQNIEQGISNIEVITS